MASFCNNNAHNRERFAEKIVNRYLNSEFALQSDRCLKILPGNSQNESDDVSESLKILFFECDRPGEKFTFNMFPVDDNMFNLAS